MKGQIFFTDVIIFMMVVMVLIVAILSTYETINNFRLKSRVDKLEFLAQDATNSLMLSRGYPRDWDQNITDGNVQALGLTIRRNIVDNTKLSVFNSSNFTKHLGLDGYNVSITIVQNSTTVYSFGTTDTTTNKIVVERLCVLNSSTCKLVLAVTGGDLPADQ